MSIVDFCANVVFAILLALWLRREGMLFIERLMAALEAAREEGVVELVEHKVEGDQGARGVAPPGPLAPKPHAEPLTPETRAVPVALAPTDACPCESGRTFGGCHGGDA